MNKKEKILFMFFEKGLTPKEIALKLKVSAPYITQIIKADSRYIAEKIKRKELSNKKQRERNINCIYKKREQKKQEKLYDDLETQHIQASLELSSRKTINNRAFRDWNVGMYVYYAKTKEYRISNEYKDNISYAAPKRIKWD